MSISRGLSESREERYENQEPDSSVRYLSGSGGCGADARRRVRRRPNADSPANGDAHAASAGDAHADSDRDELFQAEWDALVEAAQAEGKLVIAAGGSGARDSRPVWDVFQNEYGIEVLITTGTSNEVVQRLLAEQSAQRYEVDLFMMDILKQNQVDRR